MAADLQCWNCAATLAELPRPITRHMNCPKCFEDLHCCRMCRNFRDNATSPCTDERAEPPVHKEGANFCDFFRPSSASYRAGANERRRQAKSDLDALFAGGAEVAGGAEAAADAESGEQAALGEQEGAEQPQGNATADAADEKARRKLEELFR